MDEKVIEGDPLEIYPNKHEIMGLLKIVKKSKIVYRGSGGKSLEDGIATTIVNLSVDGGKTYRFPVGCSLGYEVDGKQVVYKKRASNVSGNESSEFRTILPKRSGEFPEYEIEYKHPSCPGGA